MFLGRPRCFPLDNGPMTDPSICGTVSVGFLGQTADAVAALDKTRLNREVSLYAVRDFGLHSFPKTVEDNPPNSWMLLPMLKISRMLKIAGSRHLACSYPSRRRAGSVALISAR